MKILLTGGSKSGKSHLAQDLVVGLSKNGLRFYIATMIPCDGEDRERIRLHLEDRAGLGFETIEAGRGITSVLDRRNGKGAYLLDSLTALYSNEMFHDGLVDEEAAERVIRDLSELMDKTEHLVIVTDDLYKDASSFDTLTDAYRAGLGFITREAAKKCDVVMDMHAGIPIYLKGKAVMEEMELFCEKPHIRETVIGGAFQGQEEYIRKKYMLTDEDVWVCNEETMPDFSRRALLGLEKYVRYCMRHDTEPAELPEGCIISWNDISCGLVPMDPFDRAYREKAGRYLQVLTDASCMVTYVTAGISQTIKETAG